MSDLLISIALMGMFGLGVYFSRLANYEDLYRTYDETDNQTGPIPVPDIPPWEQRR